MHQQFQCQHHWHRFDSPNWRRYWQMVLQSAPLLMVQDWSQQIGRLMADLEKDYPLIDKWCLVANGGCSPIALQVAAKSVNQQSENNTHSDTSSIAPFQQPVTNVILSSVPRLPFFLPAEDGTISQEEKLTKVRKAYRKLCGVLGRVFWWYALRKNGSFIQSFSERNLVADAANLGSDWTPNCVATARMYQGQSRFSTFSFLAGSLQVEGCRSSLNTLRSSDVKVDLIQGRDRRRNRARSLFWQRRPKKKRKPNKQQAETLEDVLKRNGNRGKVSEVSGRVSLAHEDSEGYASAVLQFLQLPR